MIYMTPLSSKAHWEWVERVARPILCADSCGIMAVKDTGEIKAAAVFDSFTASSCNIHLAIESPVVLRYGFLEAVAHEVFINRDRKRIFGLTPSDNAAARKFNEHIGMKHVAEIPDAFDDGVGYIITRMDRQSSPWLQHISEAA